MSNTALQMQMFTALDAAHSCPSRTRRCWSGSEGKLSKRLGSARAPMRCATQGIEPTALAALLARLGTSDPIEPMTQIAPC